MRYKLDKSIDIAKFKARVSVLIQKGSIVDFTEIQKQRTVSQNSAMHLYCDMIADIFNELGWTYKFDEIIGLPKDGVRDSIQIEIPYTMELVRELIWRPIQIALFGKKSTTELTTKELSQVAEYIGAAFANKGIDLEFPSIESLTREDIN